MKIFILLFLITLPALACNNKLPMPEVQKALALEPNAGSKSCADLPDESCVCYEGIDWRDAELVDNMVLDFVRKEQEESCIDEADCQVKLEALQCQFGNPIKNLESMSVYCALEVMKPDGKKLVNSPEKKARRIQEEKAAEEARIKAEEDRKASRKARIQAAKSIADLKAILLEDEK